MSTGPPEGAGEDAAEEAKQAGRQARGPRGPRGAEGGVRRGRAGAPHEHWASSEGPGSPGAGEMGLSPLFTLTHSEVGCWGTQTWGTAPGVPGGKEPGRVGGAGLLQRQGSRRLGTVSRPRTRPGLVHTV